MAGDLVYGSQFAQRFFKDAEGQVRCEQTPLDGESLAITRSTWRTQVLEPLVRMGVSEGELPSYPDEFDIDLDEVRSKNAIVIEALARMPESERPPLIKTLLQLASEGKVFFYCRT